MAEMIMTRVKALAQGVDRYYDGKACRNGHLSERGTSHGKCLQCKREKSRIFYRENIEDKATYRRKWTADNPDYFKNQWHSRPPEDRKAKKRAWYKANQEHAKAYTAQWFKDNPDKAKARKREYYKANKEIITVKNKRWTEGNPERVKVNMAVRKHRRRALEKDVKGSHTATDLKAILSAQSHKCAYCRTDLRKAKRHLDHIMPLALGGSNDRTNLQYLCAGCNLSKGAKHPIAFAQELGRLL